AGLRPGDVLTHVEGHPVATPTGGRALGAVRPGQRVRLRVRRGPASREVALVAGRRPVPGEARLRYVGRMGDVGVEVYGGREADVEVSRQGSEITITVGETRVRLRQEPASGTP
ncbi:MAG TPA: PDZ domain-containing protein, partial [Longimicrobiaceae bacterium]|nr:PDZ domain-containing protein [Longimicrobiaceae bacterium]